MKRLVAGALWLLLIALAVPMTVEAMTFVLAPGADFKSVTDGLSVVGTADKAPVFVAGTPGNILGCSFTVRETDYADTGGRRIMASSAKTYKNVANAAASYIAAVYDNANFTRLSSFYVVDNNNRVLRSMSKMPDDACDVMK